MRKVSVVRVLGIDPGTRVTGYGIVEPAGRGLSYVCGGEIRPPQRRVLSERLLILSEEISNIIEQFRPTCVAIEGLYIARNVKSAMMLGHARGVVLACAAKYGMKVFEYSPSVVKQSITGYGNASKEQVKAMVRRLVDHDVERADTADAVAVALCHLHHQSYRGRNPSLCSRVPL